MEIDPHPAQGGPRLFAFLGVVVRCLGETAHQPLDNRDVLSHRLGREAELPDFFRGQARAQLRVLHLRAVRTETLGRLECRNTKADQCGRARHHPHSERPKRGKEGADGALRSLHRILDELADALSERPDGFGLLPESFLSFLGRLGSDRFARGLFLQGDHLLVGFRDRIDGRRLPAVALQQLIPLHDQPVHTALAVGFGLLFERGDEPLDRGPGLVGDTDDLAVRRFRFLFEAVEAGVGLVDDRADLVLSFENYSFRLVAHVTLPSDCC